MSGADIAEPALTTFRAVFDVDEAAWDDRVAALHGSVFHTYAWGEYVRELRGGEAVFASWLDRNGGVAAVAVGSLRAPTTGRLARGISTLSFDAPPAQAAAAPLPSLMPLTQWARRAGAIVVQLGSFDGGERAWGVRPLPNSHERIEFIAAPGDEAEMRRRMRRPRASVHRAERSGLEVTAGGIADLPAFVDLYASTVERLKREKKDTDLGDVPKERLVAALGKLVAADRGRLYLVGNDGKSVAGCFFGVSRASAFYLFNGSTEAALQTGGTPLIMLRALTALSEAGVSRINLGGVPATAADPASPDHGLYTFKRGLGGEPVVCHGGQVQVRPVRATLFDLAKQIRKQLRG